MAIEWTNPGLASMIQGTPYRGHRHIGMPLSGAADPVSLALANWLAGNNAEAPAIETAHAPASFKAKQDMTIGIAGASRETRVNGKIALDFESLTLKAGDEVDLGAASHGCRSYIALHGGFAADSLLDGNSTYLPAGAGGSANRPIISGRRMIAASEQLQMALTRILPPEYRLRAGDQFILRFTDAPESKLAQGIEEQTFAVSRRADRIGVELEGAEIILEPHPPMKSSAVFPGTIQCPPSGNPFLLGPDAQTTGGYPRIAQVIRADCHLIGQLRPGAQIKLQRIKPAEARSLYRSKLELLRKLQPDIRLD